MTMAGDTDNSVKYDAKSAAILTDLVRVPSVSADPAHAADVERCADMIAGLFRKAGAESRLLQAAGGAPTVLARVQGPPGAPRVVLYAHYDVVPVNDEQAWTSPPFEPRIRYGRLYGRGAADDKAAVVTHLETVRRLTVEPPCTILILLDGEEEVGSPSLPTLLREQTATLRPDVVILADGLNWERGHPAVTVSTRGRIGITVEVRTLRSPVHGGIFGGPVPGALDVLARLLASLHEPDGSLVAPLRGVLLDAAGSKRPELAEPEAAELRRQAGLLPGVELIGRWKLADALWREPAVAVMGIDAPPASIKRPSLPDQSRAHIVMRTPPGCDPRAAGEALRAYLHAQVPWGACLKVSLDQSSPGSVLTADGPELRLLLSCLHQAYGHAARLIGLGASLPAGQAFRTLWPDVPVLLTGAEDPQANAHGVDESVALGDVRAATVAQILFIQALAAAAAGTQASLWPSARDGRMPPVSS
jgi:acetylornithine deacetylase/succinyl-diaminopimelate desuccinylase-like protein